jgi:hypothetical protein
VILLVILLALSRVQSSLHKIYMLSTDVLILLNINRFLRLSLHTRSQATPRAQILNLSLYEMDYSRLVAGTGLFASGMTAGG